MSNYAIVAEVSEALRSLLWAELEDDTEIHPGIVSSEQAIVFTDPARTKEQSANRLSLWLYQITENEFVKNQPPVRVKPAGDDPARGAALSRPPLALNLYYLVTPLSDDPKANHLLLGKTMQVLYDHAVVYLRHEESELAEELRIILCRLTLEELTRIWEALREAYRLSICYQVRVTRIDSASLTVSDRVLERKGGFAEKPPAPRGEQ